MKTITYTLPSDVEPADFDTAVRQALASHSPSFVEGLKSDAPTPKPATRPKAKTKKAKDTEPAPAPSEPDDEETSS